MDLIERIRRTIEFNKTQNEGDWIGKHSKHFVKSMDSGDNVIGGYLVVWGDENNRDLHDEWFTQNTSFEDKMWPIVGTPVLYHHSHDGKLKVLDCGRIVRAKFDEIGLWVEAQLSMHERYLRAIMNLVTKGILGWSSGSISHVAEVSKSGEIVRWPIVEASLTPTPAEPFRTSISALKSVSPNESDLEELLAEVGNDEEAGNTDINATKTISNVLDKVKEMNPEELIMMAVQAVAEQLGAQLTEEQVSGIVQSLLPQFQQDAPQAEAQMASTIPEEKAEGEAMAETIVTSKAFVDAIKSQISKVTNSGIDARLKARIKAGITYNNRNQLKDDDDDDDKGVALKSALPGFTGQQPPEKKPVDIRVASKYDDASAEDMSFMHSLLNAKKGYSAKPEFFKAWADKVEKEHVVVSKESAKFVKAIKANELDHSSQTGYGDEFVPELWTNQLWKTVRNDNVIAQLVQFINMPSNPYKLPLEGSDPTVYAVPETTGEANLTLSGAGNPIPDSKIGSQNLTMTAYKMGLRVGFSSELEEDSIIPIVSQYREQATRAMADAVDNVLLNADTTTGTSNINNSVATQTADGSVYLIGFEGMRHIPVVDNTANQVDAGNAAPTLSMIRAARRKLGHAYGIRVNELALIMDFSTYTKFLDINEVVTLDKFGANFTAKTGQLGQIDGVDIFVSDQMALTLATGLVDGNTAGNNTQGNALMIWKPGFRAGYRRNVNLSVDYLSYYDSYQMTATARLAFLRKNTNIAAQIINIAV